jgi:hypothetical protein
VRPQKQKRRGDFPSRRIGKLPAKLNALVRAGSDPDCWIGLMIETIETIGRTGMSGTIELIEMIGTNAARRHPDVIRSGAGTVPVGWMAG